MRFCPYFFNPYSNMYDTDEKDDTFRDYYEEEDEQAILSEDEGQDYYDDMMRQGSVQDINRILGLVDSRFGYLYTELQRRGINRNTARYMFRTMVAYTINNASKYTGTPEQRTTAILNDFSRQYYWIFYILRVNGVTTVRVNEIARTIIAFTLANLHAQPVPPEDLDQRAARITNLIRQQTDIFTRLQNFGITASAANTFVRTVVLYVLRNSTPGQAPVNLEARAAELVRMFESANPAVIREMQNSGVAIGQIRVLLRAIILFTLRSIYSREDE